MIRFTSTLLAVLLVVNVGTFAADGSTHGTFLTSDGLNIRYLARGNGVPVVLVYGFEAFAYNNATPTEFQEYRSFLDVPSMKIPALRVARFCIDVGNPQFFGHEMDDAGLHL